MADDERDPLGRSWKMWGGVLGGLVVVLVVGLVLIPLFTRTGWNAPATTPAASSLPPVSEPASAPASDGDSAASSSASASSSEEQPAASGDCPKLSEDTSFPDSMPKTKWVAHPSGSYVPTNSEFGPAKRDGSFWRCFSRTPKGATYAGINLLVDFLTVKDAGEASQRREELFKESDVALPRVTGYKVINSSADGATVRYFYESEEGPAAVKVRVVWDDKAGDWRLDLNDLKIQAGASSDTFTDWR